MLRIGQVEATATQDGKYTDGSVAGGIAATRLRAAAFNAMQEELAHIVESAGLALDIKDMTQVLKAIQKLTLSRINPFADIKSDGAAAISTALANLGIPDALNLRMEKSKNGSDIADKGAFQNNLGLSFNGSQNSFTSKGPGLMIQQGGKITAPGGTGNTLTVNFPIAFPNGCVAAFAIFEDGVFNQVPFQIGIIPESTLMKVNILSQGGTIYFNNRSIRWFAVGF